MIVPDYGDVIGVPLPGISMVPDRYMPEGDAISTDGGRSYSLHPVTMGQWLARLWYRQYRNGLPFEMLALIVSAEVRCGRDPLTAAP